MVNKIPERITWAVGLLDVRPDDRVLEIGCGSGAAAFIASEKLNGGKLTAIDRSEKMAATARDRNRAGIAAGKVEILHTDLLAASLPAGEFDKIFLFNVNVFWMDPKAELLAIMKYLAPDGRFFIFHQPPPGGDSREYSAEFEKNLKAQGFEVLSVEYNDEASIRSVCVTSRVSRR